MTAFSSYNTNAQTAATSLATAVANMNIAASNLSAAGIGALTLSGLSSTNVQWRQSVADMRGNLASILADIATVNDRYQRLAAAVAQIAALD